MEKREIGNAWMEKREGECMDGDSEERRSAWMETVKRSAWMETVKRERECMDGDSEEREKVHEWKREREKVHGWRQ